METQGKDYLLLSDGSKLKWLDTTYKTYLNRMTVLYGPTGSGKTTILNEIMYLLNHHIPLVFVIAPTNFANGIYTDKIPSRCIKPGTSVDDTIDFLQKLLVRQKNVTNIYNMVNNVLNLKSIFDKIVDTRAKALANLAVRGADKSLKDTMRSHTLNIAEKKSKKIAIIETRDSILRRIYKICISKHKDSLARDSSLTKKQNLIIRFLYINPQCLLLLDDCASRFKTWVKKSTVIKEIFYEFRHYNGTTVILAQNDKEIDSEFRKNVHNSIFADEQSAISNFTRASNGYGKPTKKRAAMCVEVVYPQDATKCKHFKKLLYFNNSADPFRFFQADLYEDFRMCGDGVWKLNKKIDVVQRPDKDDNPIFNMYI